VLIIVDTAQKLMRLHDVSDYAETTNRLEPVTNLARECGAHLALTHHGKKSGGDHGDAALGSTGLFGSVDTLIELRRGERYRTARSFQRYGTDLDEVVLGMDPDTYRITLDGTRKEADERHAAAQIQQYLSTSGPARRSDITENVEGRQAVKVDALKKAVREGRVVRTGTGKKGDPIFYAIVGAPNVKSPEGEAEEKNEPPENSEMVVPDAPGYKGTTIFEGSGHSAASGREAHVKEQLYGEREYSACPKCQGEATYPDRAGRRYCQTCGASWLAMS
jgi:hypothetical protein